MRAIQVEEPGGLNRLKLVEMPDPVANPSEVVIDVAYAAANWSDIQRREGVYPDPVKYPTVLGAEVSGKVLSIGESVDNIATGQRVAAITAPLFGGYAEQCVVSADFVIPLPDSLSFALGAAFPVVTLTAYHLVNNAYSLKSGDIVLIHSIGGAVGLAVTQLALLKGATVIGTVGYKDKGDRAKKYGAHLIIDRSKQDFVSEVQKYTNGKGIDLVIDSLGGEFLPQSIGLLKTYGHLINIGEAAGYPNFDIRRKIYENSTSLAGFELLHAKRVPGLWEKGVTDSLELLTSEDFEMPIEQVFPFDKVRELHQKLESRTVSGKLLLQIKKESEQLDPPPLTGPV